MKFVFSSIFALFITSIAFGSAASASTSVYMTKNDDGSWAHREAVINDGSTKTSYFSCDLQDNKKKLVCKPAGGDSVFTESPTVTSAPTPVAVPAPVYQDPYPYYGYRRPIPRFGYRPRPWHYRRPLSLPHVLPSW